MLNNLHRKKFFSEFAKSLVSKLLSMSVYTNSKMTFKCVRIVWIAGRQATPLAPTMVETPPGGHLLQSKVQKVPGLLIKLFY